MTREPQTTYSTEEHPYYNLMGALIDIKRQWKEADPICIETIERVLRQIKDLPCSASQPGSLGCVDPRMQNSIAKPTEEDNA